MKKKLIGALIGAMMILSTAISAGAIGRASYDWSNVPVGANGFVTGVVLHPKEKNLMYIRTDVGGAYRWDEEQQKWIQLCDVFGMDQSNYYGIDGIAIDPNDPDVVYMAAGANPWSNGDVLKSTDRGQTWTETGLLKKFSGNGSYRGSGEPIMVDPVNSSVIYCGTFQEGMYRSTNGAKTWVEINAGLDYKSDGSAPIRTIAIDKSSEKDGRCTRIYANVMGVGTYVSEDCGDTWTLMEDAPQKVNRMEIDSKGVVYAAADTGLFKYENGEWTNIGAEGLENNRYNAVTIDPSDEKTLMVIIHTGNTNAEPIYVSHDAGETWENRYDNIVLKQYLPWAKGYGVSANGHDIKIDPFDSGRVFLTDWFGVYHTDNIYAEPTQEWTNQIEGIEEVVPRDGYSPATGDYRLIVGIADVDGFVYKDVTKYPERQVRLERQEADEPWMMSTTQVDCCLEKPEIVLRVGVDWNVNGKVELSTDNTETWTNITNIPTYVDASGNPTTAIPMGRCAVSSKINPETGYPSMVILPAYNPNDSKRLPEGMATVPWVSLDLGKTWKQVEGLPSNINVMDDYWDTYNPLVSDKVAGNKFYLFGNDYNMYVSEDWGQTWTQTTHIQGDMNTVIVRATPGKEGDVWVGIGQWGLWHSTDGGQTFTKNEYATSVTGFGFGVAAPGLTDPAMYLVGSINGINAIFRSDDMGNEWVKITDDEHKQGAAYKWVVGDSRTYGVVYIGTQGRGIYLGAPKGTDLTYKEEESTTDEGETQAVRPTIFYNGSQMPMADIPITPQGDVMIPVREFLTYYHMDMTWDDATKSLTAKRNILDVSMGAWAANGSVEGISLVIGLDNNVIQVNGKDIELSTAPYLYGGQMYAPLEELVDALGGFVKKSADGSEIKVYDNGLIMHE